MQSYHSHAHHPYPTYIAGIFLVTAIVCLTGQWLLGWDTGWPGAVALSLAVAMLVSTSRTYTTGLQNRIIRLEMHVRLREVLPDAQRHQIAELTMAQLVALRFASDAELPALVERAVRERLSRDEIKKAIRNWQPDFFRT
jgi:Family of unknown function (DUF6526)